MRAVQHKCLPHLACINPMQLLFYIFYLIRKMILKFENFFWIFFSFLQIFLNIFQFLAKILKRIWN